MGENSLEQVTSRPIWTPNTAKQQNAEVIEQLRKELNKCKEDLASEEEIFAEKAKEIEAQESELTQKVQETLMHLINCFNRHCARTTADQYLTGSDIALRRK